MRLKILVVISYASLALGSAILQKRASIEDSCKDVSSLMKLSLATVQTMGKTAASQVDWYMKNWKASNLNEDRAKRKTIADAFRFIFGWEIDHQKGDKTTKYEFVRTTLPGDVPPTLSSLHRLTRLKSGTEVSPMSIRTPSTSNALSRGSSTRTTG